MLNYCNILSLSRIVFAFIFFCGNPLFRFFALFGAMISDFLDGFLARQLSKETRFGEILDPIMDKLFVLISGSALFVEGGLTLSGLILIFSRDVFLCIFCAYLTMMRGWKGYNCKAMLWGKICTLAQFSILVCITFSIQIPYYCFLLFIPFGFFSFLERIYIHRKNVRKAKSYFCEDKR